MEELEVFHCETGACSPQSCRIHHCMAELKARNYLEDTVCGNDGRFFLQQGEYCNAKTLIGSPLTLFLLCDGDSRACENQKECRQQYCT